MVTEAELAVSRHTERDLCEGCPNLCWLACPAEAFASGRYDQEACQAYCGGSATKLSDAAELGKCGECENACPVGVAEQ